MCGITIATDLVHDTRHLFTRSKIDGIKAMYSRGISEGKQVIKFANTSNAVEFVYSIKRDDDFIVSKVLERFTSLLFAMRTFTVATAYCKVKMITSTHNLTLSSLR